MAHSTARSDPLSCKVKQDSAGRSQARTAQQAEDLGWAWRHTNNHAGRWGDCTALRQQESGSIDSKKFARQRCQQHKPTHPKAHNLCLGNLAWTDNITHHTPSRQHRLESRSCMHGHNPTRSGSAPSDAHPNLTDYKAPQQQSATAGHAPPHPVHPFLRKLCAGLHEHSNSYNSRQHTP